MQYTVSMTTRMLVIAGFCMFLLCVLLFLLGIEIGKRYAQPLEAPVVPTVALPAVPAAPSMPATPQLPAPAAPLAFPAPAAKP